MTEEEKNKKIVLLKLFISTLYLSTFTFGGGYVIVTLMKKKFVDEYHWIDGIGFKKTIELEKKYKKLIREVIEEYNGKIKKYKKE